MDNKQNWFQFGKFNTNNIVCDNFGQEVIQWEK